MITYSVESCLKKKKKKKKAHYIMSVRTYVVAWITYSLESCLKKKKKAHYIFI